MLEHIREFLIRALGGYVTVYLSEGPTKDQTVKALGVCSDSRMSCFACPYKKFKTDEDDCRNLLMKQAQKLLTEDNHEKESCDGQPKEE